MTIFNILKYKYLLDQPVNEIVNIIKSRCIHTASPLQGKRNFRKFKIPNKRGFKEFREQQRKLGLIDHRGVRFPGYIDIVTKNFKVVPEQIPELIVPNLEGFKLKPYISYQAQDVVQSEFSAKELFDSIYAVKIKQDFLSGNLDEDGNPLNPSEAEKLTPDEAKIRAKMTGSDIFLGVAPEFPK